MRRTHAYAQSNENDIERPRTRDRGNNRRGYGRSLWPAGVCVCSARIFRAVWRRVNGGSSRTHTQTRTRTHSHIRCVRVYLDLITNHNSHNKITEKRQPPKPPNYATLCARRGSPSRI